MRQLIKTFLWIVGCLTLGLPVAWAFSMLGPIGNGGDGWQVDTIGFGIDGDIGAPKNLGEGYRRNTPVMYYAFDPTFGDFFGSQGEDAVAQAFDVMNGVMNGQTNSPLLIYDTASPNVPTNGYVMGTNGAFDVPVALTSTNSLDSYSTDLSEFPLNTLAAGNSSASQLSLVDLKSFTLWALTEQMGLADAVRFTWVLHDRYVPSGATCTAPGNYFGGYTNINGVEYIVVLRNFYISPTSPNQLQYTNYINGVLYDYDILDNCGASGISPPTADAYESMSSGVGGVPVSSIGAVIGAYLTGLTRDDVAGLRWLYSTNNYDTPSTGYRESPAAGSAQLTLGPPQLLFTSNYNALVIESLTNDPTTLQALVPGLQLTLVTNYFSNVVSATTEFVTNYPIGQPSGQPYIGLQTTYSTNIVEFYQYIFNNVVTNRTYTNTSYALQTITIGPPIGSPVGTPFVTNVTYQTFQSNVVSGDFYIITNGACPPTFIDTLQTNVNVVTNILQSVVNPDGSSIVENLVSYFTNYAFVVHSCVLSTTNPPADYQGIGRMQFVRVRDDNYDPLSGQFVIPITNQYNMVFLTNSQWVTRTFQRVVTSPDFQIAASDLLTGPSDLPIDFTFSRNINFNQSNIQGGLAGPGTIDPSTLFTYNKVGPIYYNLSSTNGDYPNGVSPSSPFGFVWGSFDGSTNPPVVYGNGASLTNLLASSLIHISPAPPALLNGTLGSPYNVTFTATGTDGPVTWTLAPYSATLPSGLTLTSTNSVGTLSGTPTQSGTFNNIVVQMMDSASPPHIVQTIYSLIITNAP